MTPHAPLTPARRRMLAMLAVATSASLTGCSTVGSVAKAVGSSVANAFSGEPAPAFLDVDGLTLLVDAEANGRGAFAVDLVYAKDTKTLELLQSMPATKWFAARSDVQRSHPDSITVRGWELVPRQVVRLDRDALGSPRVAGVLIFADYRTPGEHRALLPELPDGATVRFGPAGFDVVARTR